MDANGGADNLLCEVIHSAGISKHACDVCKSCTAQAAGTFTTLGRKDRIYCDESEG
jgi:hypothetical protein